MSSSKNAKTDETSALNRHPEDGWIMAEPLPMSEGTRRAFRAVILALCPPPPAPSSEELIDTIEQHARRLIRYMHPTSTYGFVVAIHLVAWSPLWLFQGFQPLTKLSRARGSYMLSILSHSHVPLVRMLLLALKGVVLSTYFDQDSVHQALSYAPQPFMVQRVQLRKRILAGEAPTEADALPTGGAA